jgi:hypothetical protein
VYYYLLHLIEYGDPKEGPPRFWRFGSFVYSFGEQILDLFPPKLSKINPGNNVAGVAPNLPELIPLPA